MARSDVDKNLRALVSYLQEMAARGTMERGQREVIDRRVSKLRRALRNGKVPEIRSAIDDLARVLLRNAGK